MSEKRRALMLASVASMIDQFNMDNIRILQELGYSVDVVADFVDGGTITSERIENLKMRLSDMGVEVFHVAIPRNIINVKGIFKSYTEVKKLCEEKHYRLVHCHSPIGGVVARMAARKEREKGTRVIYTAHGFHFFKGAPLKNWLFFYPVEKFCSLFTDTLITINAEDYERAKKIFHAKDTVYVPGVGVDIEKFRSGLVNIQKKRTALGVDNDDILILSVGEFNKNKNHEIIINALKKIDNEKIKYFIVGKGELEEYLKDLILKSNLEDKVKLLGYRSDVSELCQAADLFVFPSHREGLPVALMEAIASGIPVVGSRIRGNEDLILDSEDLFDQTNVNDVENCLNRVLKNKKRHDIQEDFRDKIEANYKHLQSFDLHSVNQEMLELYGCGGGRLHKLIRQQMYKKTMNIPLENLIVVSVGELNDNKNHQVIINAIKTCISCKYTYIIAGIGKNHAMLEELAKKNRIQLIMLGYCKEIPDLYQNADVCAFPSIREGLGMAALEGMASGIPLVAVKNRGTVEYASDGYNAYLEKWNDYMSLGKDMEHLGICYKDRTTMGYQARVMAERFSKNQVNIAMKKIYEKICD